MHAVEVDREEDGRWIAEVRDLPGVLVYGQTRDEAVRRAQALSLRVMADRVERGEPLPQMLGAFSVIVERDNPWFVASSPEVPGANGQGLTFDEALHSVREAIALMLEDALEQLRSEPCDDDLHA